MIWNLISVVMCALLVTKLLFWTDEHRRKSRWHYRVLLYLVTLYAGNVVVNFISQPLQSIPPWLALFHTSLLCGAFIVKPEHLPWNGYSKTSKTASRLRHWLETHHHS